MQHIYENDLPIKLQIIVCNPRENEFICKDDDIQKIEELMKVMIGINAEVYASEIPPAIRASTVYIDGHAIWSATQSYQFQRSKNNKIELIRPKDSLIVTCDENNSKRDFDGIIKCFESEYDRLKSHSKHPQIDENGNIVYVKNEVSQNDK